MADTRLNLTQAAKAAGITRRTLYNHINQGKVTASRDEKNSPVIDVSELIRAYGNVNLTVKKIPTPTHRENIHKNYTPDALSDVRKELAELKEAITLMLEDKNAREEERQRGEDERRQLQEEVKRLGEQLEQEKARGLWSRIFAGRKPR